GCAAGKWLHCVGDVRERRHRAIRRHCEPRQYLSLRVVIGGTGEDAGVLEIRPDHQPARPHRKFLWKRLPGIVGGNERHGLIIILDIHQHGQDYDETMPFVTTYDPGQPFPQKFTMWTSRLVIGPYLKNTGIFSCPSDDNTERKVLPGFTMPADRPMSPLSYVANAVEPFSGGTT